MKQEPSPSVERFRILVADDVREIRDILRYTLSFFYDVILARNGEEAWELINSERPDALITDLVMPRIKGIELVQLIRLRSPVPDIPIIIMTGATKDKELPDPFWKKATPCQEFVTKPFSPFEVRAMLGKYLRDRTPRHHPIRFNAGT
jgi:CheY-like chemotaxis protein